MDAQITEMIVWGIIFIVFSVVETFTIQLISIWCAIASLASFVAAYLGASVFVQIVIFLIVSAVLIASTRPIYKKFIKRTTSPTNADALVGLSAVVISRIDNVKSTGRVMVSGQDWAAKSLDGSVIEEQKVVVIKRIEGVTLIVGLKGDL